MENSQTLEEMRPKDVLNILQVVYLFRALGPHQRSIGLVTPGTIITSWVLSSKNKWCLSHSFYNMQDHHYWPWFILCVRKLRLGFIKFSPECNTPIRLRLDLRQNWTAGIGGGLVKLLETWCMSGMMSLGNTLVVTHRDVTSTYHILSWYYILCYTMGSLWDFYHHMGPVR